MPPTVRNGKAHRPRRYRTVDAKGVRKAQAALRAYLDELEQHQCTDPATLTVAGLAGQWLAWVEENRRPATHHFYAGQLERHILPAIGTRVASQIEPKDLKALYNARREGKNALAEYSRRHIHVTVQAAYSWAVIEGLLDLNPAKRVRNPPRQVAKRERRTWSEQQITQALARAKTGLRNRRNLVYLPMMLAGWSGLREAEVCGLRWDDLDFEGGTLTVSRELEQTKGGRLHVTPPKTPESAATLPMPAIIIDALREAHAIFAGLQLATGAKWNPLGYVMVTRKDTPVKPSNLASSWRSFCLRNGLPPITFHELRHSFLTNLFEAGEDLITVQKAGRHSNPYTTASLYLHKTEEQRRDAIRRQDERIAAAAIAEEADNLRPIRDTGESGQRQAV
jgi:integrase